MEPKMLARSGDPATSHEAAETVESFAMKFRHYILRELRKGPGTFEELSKRTGLRPDQVWRRLSDLEKEGLAFPTSDIRRGESGRQQRVWQAW